MNRTSTISALLLSVGMGLFLSPVKTVAIAADKTSSVTINGAPVVAMVLDKNGPWQVQKGDQSIQLKRGDGIPKDYSLQPLTPDSTIVLVSTDGKHLKYPGNLDIKAPMEAALPQSSTQASKWWSTIVNLFTTQLPGSVIQVSRDIPGPGCIALRDAVLKRDGVKLDIKPLFKDEPGGSYQLEIDSLNPDGSTYVMGEPSTVTFERGQPDLVTMPNLADGLYRVAITPQDGQTTGDDSWALVNSGQMFDKNSAAFKTAVENTSGDADITAGGLRWFLRTYLALLNKPAH